MDTVLALGFDLFFKPRMSQAAEAVGVQVRFARPEEAVPLAQGAARVVADASAPGVEEALRAVRAARPDVPILACYPHVEAQRAVAVRALGGTAVTRGAFAARLEDALGGRMEEG
jgi:CheY-like chemotaxis protein